MRKATLPWVGSRVKPRARLVCCLSDASQQYSLMAVRLVKRAIVYRVQSLTTSGCASDQFCRCASGRSLERRPLLLYSLSIKIFIEDIANNRGYGKILAFSVWNVCVKVTWSFELLTLCAVEFIVLLVSPAHASRHSTICVNLSYNLTKNFMSAMLTTICSSNDKHFKVTFQIEWLTIQCMKGWIHVFICASISINILASTHQTLRNWIHTCTLISWRDSS
jgi:hypothetical protein